MFVTPSIRLLATFLLVWSVTAGSLLFGDERASDKLFQARIRPVLERLCFECHGESTQEADLRLDTMDDNFDRGGQAETWHDVLNKLNLGEMPPEDAQPIDDQSRELLVNWITERIKIAARNRRTAQGPVRLRRLTRYEYDNTMRDLLGVELDFAENLPPEPKSEEGFKNNARSLGISPLQMEMYLASARRGLAKAIVIGEQPAVFEQLATKSASGKGKRQMSSNRLDRQSRFMLVLKEFPRQGRFLVRVKARAEVPDNAPLPRMRVTIGLRADVRSPEKDLAEVDLAATDELQQFEFEGRIESFPLPGHNPKYPGLRVTVYNHFDGAPPRKKKRKKRDESEASPVSVDPIIRIESVEFIGPMYASWPPASHTNIFFGSVEDYDDESNYAQAIIRRFATRAFRRPVTDEDIAPALAMYHRLRSDYETLEETMREVLAVVLISPDFLYLVEPQSRSKQAGVATDYELASRLSYFLWSTMPDEQLLKLADAKQLASPRVLATQVQRMLADPRSRQFVNRFTEQWLDLGAVDRIAVNPEFHPNFDDRLKQDMQQETQLLFAAVVDENLSALTLLDADFTMLNRRLAKHYGLSGPRGLEFERVALTETDRRGGLLTHGSFLLANSNGEDSHPIKRAVWLLDRLLDSPPAPPPPDVPELDAKQKDFVGLSLKQQLEAHRTKPACNSCHRRIDPWGIAFENYDAVGRWRDTQLSAPKRRKRTPMSGTQVDSRAELPDGVMVDGVDQLRDYLLSEQRERFAKAIVKRLLTYALGRSLDWSDQPQVDALTSKFVTSEFRIRPLIVAIVQSNAFRSK